MLWVSLFACGLTYRIGHNIGYGRGSALVDQVREIAPSGEASSETRMRVAVIDTGIDLEHPRLKPYLCLDGHKDFVGTGLQDTHGHGTHIAGLIMKGLDSSKYCVMALKYYDNTGLGYNNLANEIKAFRWATSYPATLINLAGGGNHPSSVEVEAIRQALDAGSIVVVAAGNDGMDLSKNCSYFPACSVKHQSFYPVGSVNRYGKALPSSNYGGPVVNWAYGLMQLSTLPGNKMGTMSGTSQATANFSNRLLGGEGTGYKE